MTYKQIIHKVSEDTKIPYDIVDKVYKSFWTYVRNQVQELPLKDDLTMDQFITLKPNFNIPSIGKMCCTYDKYKRIKYRFNNIKSLRDKNEESN